MTHELSDTFRLIETMVYIHRITYLQGHMERLHRSATYFSIPANIDHIRDTLIGLEGTLPAFDKHKVRLTVAQSGDYRIEISPIIASIPQFRKACISPIPIASDNAFRHHKTTQRDLYTTEYDRVSQQGYYEVFFLNEQGAVAEGSRTNLLIRKTGLYYTPPLLSGALGGVYRQALLQRCPDLKEECITIEDLKQAERVYVCNAVTGLVRIHQIDFSSAHQ